MRHSNAHSRPRRRAAAVALTLLALAFAAPALPCAAQEAGEDHWRGPGGGPQWMTPALARGLFPGADRTEPPGGEPPAAAVFAGNEPLGFVFRTIDATASLGFSSSPFYIAAGLRLDGTLTGIRILEHSEPIIDLYATETRLPGFVSAYGGLDVRRPHRVSTTGGETAGVIDAISGATISSVLFNEAILNAARLVARARGIVLSEEPAVDLVEFREATFASLAADGSIGRLRPGADDAPLDLYFAPVAPPTIGRALLGNGRYNLWLAGRDPRDLAVLLMARAPYEFDPHALRPSGALDRVHIVQNGRRFALSRERYRYLNRVRGGAPEFGQMGMYWIEAAEGIDPLAPWRLEARAEDGGAVFGADYRLAERYIARPPPRAEALADAGGPAWLAAWRAQSGNLAILGALLAALTAILLFVRPLTRRPRLYAALRLGFLAFVLVWLGWIAGAQLTVMNALAWMRALWGEFTFGMFMSDPLVAVLAVFVAVTFVVWGRGIFCGWLCPFGALQELLGKLARLLRIPAATLGPAARRRLAPVKYVVLAGLAGLSLHSMTAAGAAAEIEPFKTAVSMHFARDWPFVAWAAALLAAALFVERFFCRVLCPLGAAMALGGKLRLRRLDPLPRRAQCGSPCRLCERNCPVQAIRPNGKIDMDECFYCLDCQVLYRDEHSCPPLASARRRRERAPAAAPA